MSIPDFSHIHESSALPIFEQDFEDTKVVIGDDCLIGAKATTRPGINIGNGAVIEANTIVTKDVPEFAVFVGAP